MTEKILEKYEKEGYLCKETIHGEIKKAAVAHPNKTALVDGDGLITYGQLDKYSDELVAYFAKEGINKGDIVLLQIPNCNMYVVMLVALLKAGIKPVLLLPTHREKEIISVSGVVKAKAYIGMTDFMGVNYVKMVSTIQNLNIQCIYTNEKYEETSYYPCKVWPRFGENIVDRKPEYNDDYRSTALYLLSGGTTNLPKVIPRIHEAYVYNSKAACERAEITENTVNMAVLSASHDYQLASPGVLGTLYKGGTVVLCQTPGFDEAFEMIEKYGVTFTCIVPAIASVWLEVLEWYQGDFSSLKNMVVGAAKLDEDMAYKLIDKLGVKLHQAYGLGEGITCMTSLDDDMDTILHTQGRPVSDGDAIKIVDENGKTLEPYKKGELLEKGPYTFLGYYGNSKLNEDLFDAEGYLKTGDKAYIDKKGNVVICGRIKEQINRAGENVLPIEVETILRSHPDIKEAAVFGREDEKLGERTTAVIVTKNKEITLLDITKFFVKQGIAKYKIPDELHVWKELYYTNVGKIDKKRIKKKLEEENDRIQ